MIDADKKRVNESLKIVAGILVTHMVTMHIQQFYNTDTFFYYWQNLLLCFFMPWFFFKSGMFFNYKVPKQLFYNTSEKLLKPFVIFSLLGEIIYILLMVSSGLTYEPIKSLKILLRGSLSGNPVLWFLPVLFLVRNLSNYLLKISINKWFFFFLFISFFTIHLYSTVNSNCLPWWLGDVILGCFFYVAGALLKEILYNNYIYYVSIIVYVTCVTTYPSLVNFWSCKIVYGSSYVWIISSLSGIIIINNFFYRLVRYKKYFVIFDFVGGNSMYYYCLHWMIINLCLLILGPKTSIENTLELITVLIVCFCLCAIVSWIINNKCVMSNERNK